MTFKSQAQFVTSLQLIVGRRMVPPIKISGKKGCRCLISEIDYNLGLLNAYTSSAASME